MPGRTLDRLLDPAYLGDVRSHPLDRIRAMRAECQDVETGLSLARRLVQGRLDIVGLELRRRAEGGDRADLSELIARLPDVLAEHTRAGGTGRLTPVFAPEAPDGAFEAELDAIAGEAVLANLPSIEDAQLRSIADDLEALERRVSEQRHQLHGQIDALQAEVTRRYREGEASIDELLQGR